MQLKTILRLVLLITLLVVLTILIGRLLPTSVGTSDFVGYWACARLLFRGQDPYNADNILKVQREVYPNLDYPMYSWNPPWLSTLLLPLGALPFPQATTTWLLVNLLLIAASSLGIWWLFDGDRSTSPLWIALPIAFLFAHTLTVLDTGQITTFVLVGVVGFLVAFKLGRDILAGAFLALTTIKPHLVFLWLPLVFLWTLEKRRWWTWFGFGSALAILLLVLTVFLPSWPKAYSAILDSPPTNWATPTLGGLMAVAWGENLARFLGLVFLPTVILLWRKTRHHSPELVTAGLVPLSLGLAVFGWSYDQILLLLPIIAIVVSLVRRELPTREMRITAALLGILAVALFVQRVRVANEIYFFWVPWGVLLISAWTAWRHRQNRRQLQDSETVPPEVLDGAIH